MKAAGDVELRPATPGDTSRVLDLVKLSLGEGAIPRSEEYWNWKHRANPFGPSPGLLAVSGNDLVGVRMFLRWQWQANGAKRRAVRAVDTATHPDWRGRGIFTRLTLALLEDMRSEGVSFVFNTPNSQSRPGYLKMGWKQIGRVSLWIRPMRPGAMLAARLKARGRSWAEGCGDPKVEVGTPASALLESDEIRRFVDTVSASPSQLSTPRSMEYLRWRYASVPGIDYRVVLRIQDSRGALIIFRVKQARSLRELRLCEVLVGPDRSSRRVTRGLLRFLLGESKAHYAAAMATTGSAALPVLAATGFIPVPRIGPVMTIRPLNHDTSRPDPLHRSNWHCSIGDLELF